MIHIITYSDAPSGRPHNRVRSFDCPPFLLYAIKEKMGRRDYQWREEKKPKKGAKKPSKVDVLPAIPEPEVIKVKGKKEKE